VTDQSRHVNKRTCPAILPLDAARDRQDDLQPTDADEFGQRYVLDFPMTTAAGSATIRSAWIVLIRQDVLRLTSCYVL
jgi:hypothetical protein